MSAICGYVASAAAFGASAYAWHKGFKTHAALYAATGAIIALSSYLLQGPTEQEQCTKILTKGMVSIWNSRSGIRESLSPQDIVNVAVKKEGEFAKFDLGCDVSITQSAADKINEWHGTIDEKVWKATNPSLIDFMGKKVLILLHLQSP